MALFVTSISDVYFYNSVVSKFFRKPILLIVQSIYSLTVDDRCILLMGETSLPLTIITYDTWGKEMVSLMYSMNPKRNY